MLNTDTEDLPVTQPTTSTTMEYLTSQTICAVLYLTLPSGWAACKQATQRWGIMTFDLMRIPELSIVRKSSVTCNDNTLQDSSDRAGSL